MNSLFDDHGVCRPDAPQALLSTCHIVHRPQPSVDYRQVLYLLRANFPAGSHFVAAQMFERRCRAAKAALESNPATAGVLKGVCLPICIPRLTVGDYGATLSRQFLPAAARACRSCAEGRIQFFDLVGGSGSLRGKIDIVTDSRHEQLFLAAVKHPVVGLFFPFAFYGYSVEHARRQMKSLPDRFLLGGGIDTLSAMAAYPECFETSTRSLELSMAAVRLIGSEQTLFVGSRRDAISVYNFLSSLGEPSGAGLLVLG